MAGRGDTATRMRTKGTILKALVWAAALFVGCTSTGKVKRPSAVSLVPSVTETIFAMEAQDHLLAVSNYCNYPPEVRKLPRVGSLLAPSYEKIAELNPDVVFITLPMQKDVRENLKKLGIRTVDISPESVDEILQSFVRVGDVLNEHRKGQRLRDSLARDYEKLLRKANSLSAMLPRPLKFYIELSSAPLYTVGRKSFLSDYLRKLHCRNLFDDVDASYFAVNPERVVVGNPDVILLLYRNADREQVMSRAGWQDIDAVKNGKVYVIEDVDIFLRPGPRFVEAMRKLLKIIEEAANEGAYR